MAVEDPRGRYSGPQPMLAKWWSKHANEHGRIDRHLSSNEQHVVKSFVQGIPFKTLRKTKENAAVIVPMLVLLVGVMQWAPRANAKHHQEHWD